jgi:hypothetical protein
MDTRDMLERLHPFGTVLAAKLYRLTLDPPPAIPLLPCLDHEAMLHENISPHVAAYVQERGTGDLHELVFIPARRRIEVDTVSTWGESSPASLARLTTMLGDAYPGWRIRVNGPSWWRGDRRVAIACREQVTLRDVLLSDDAAGVTARIARLQTIGSLMEKESRVASWGVRTVTGPILPAVGVLTYFALDTLIPALGEEVVRLLQYSVVGLLGAAFLYYGLKAVQLTEMSNRVWKRGAEYTLILSERRRLRARDEARDLPAPHSG